MTRGGSKVLDIAIINERPDLAELSIRHGADIDDSIEKYPDLLVLAIRHAGLAFVRLLIERGCTVNTMMADDVTPLRMAIEWSSDEVIMFLIHAGADLGAMDSYGMTCHCWLRRLRPHLEVRQHLNASVQAGFSSPNMTVLKRTVARLLTEMRERIPKDFRHSLYLLARCLLLLGREGDARSAFQVGILIQFEEEEGVIRKSAIMCDHCDEYQNDFEPFYACKLCPDIDLCERCMRVHEKTGTRAICRDHGFMRIVASESDIRSIEAMDEWLERLGKLITEF